MLGGRVLRQSVVAVSDRTRVRGWGRGEAADCDVLAPDPAGLSPTIELAGPRGVLPRGAGRSYGDAAGNSGGQLLHVAGGLDLHVGEGLATVGAGTSFEDVLRECLPHGWVLPVLPGTRMLTVGGAVAADVHGKNHPYDGTLSGWVEALWLTDGEGRERRLVPGEPEFDATTGGMGLTGVVTRVALRLVAVQTSSMVVRERRHDNLDALLDGLATAARQHRYAVAWVDGLASGSARGRGIVSAAEHAELAQTDGSDPLAYAPRTRLAAPAVPTSLVTRASARVFNELWWRHARPDREFVAPLTSYFHPLDGVRGWNRLYGPRGFLQYQFVVPDSGVHLVGHALHAIADAHGAPFLGVLKRFGRAGSGHLSFPRPGWSLAVDLPHTPGLASVLDGLDGRVAAAGGAVYLAKDARLRPRHLAEMYPRLEQWRQIRDAMDPLGRFRSDLDRRLELTGRG